MMAKLRRSLFWSEVRKSMARERQWIEGDCCRFLNLFTRDRGKFLGANELCFGEFKTHTARYISERIFHLDNIQILGNQVNDSEIVLSQSHRRARQSCEVFPGPVRRLSGRLANAFKHPKYRHFCSFLKSTSKHERTFIRTGAESLPSPARHITIPTHFDFPVRFENSSSPNGNLGLYSTPSSCRIVGAISGSDTGLLVVIRS